MVLGMEVWDQVVGRAGSLWRFWGPVRSMLLSWLLVAACSPWLRDSPLQSLSSLLCFFSLCLSSLNPGWSHLDILNLITSTKTIFPNEVEFTGIGGLGLSLKFWGTTIHLYGCESWTEEGWTLKNWCFWTVVLEKTLESPLNWKKTQPVNLKGNQPWIFFGRTEAEAETPFLWPPDAKNWLIRKDSDVGKDWRQEEKQLIKDVMVGWHQWLNGHEFEQALGIGDGQGSLVCCSPWDCKESDTTEWLNDNSSVSTLKLKCNMYL